MKVLNMTLDTEYQLAYAYLASGKVARTIEVNQTINIDVKENGEPFGVEFLCFDSLNHTKDALLAENNELTDAELEAVLVAQEKVRERLAD